MWRFLRLSRRRCELCWHTWRPNQSSRTAERGWLPCCGRIIRREARNNLRYALYNLRQAIHDQESQSPLIITERGTIQFNPEKSAGIDVSCFTQLLYRKKGESSDHGKIEAAIRLYRGDFLEGFDLPDSLEFDEWITSKRAETRRMMVDALGMLADYYEKSGEYSEALIYARRQIEMEPWQEKGHRQLMRLLTFKGQPGAALAHYEQYLQHLQTELGVKPAKDTQGLAELIRTDSGAYCHQSSLKNQGLHLGSGECPYRGLAAFRAQDAPFFFGRTENIEHLLYMLREQPLVVVVGSSGSGKSSLIFAGVVPVLRQSGEWLSFDFRPGQRPFHRLAACSASLVRSAK